MPLFSKTKSYLGVDFDSHSVKVVELKNEGGRPKLVTYGYYDRDLDQLTDTADINNQESQGEAAELIKDVCRRAKTTAIKAITSLPAYSVFSSILNLPPMSKNDLPSAVVWEAKKIVPLPVEEMILDWKLLEDAPAEVQGKPQAEAAAAGEGGAEINELNKKGFLKIESGGGKKYSKILLTAAAKDLVKRYMAIFEAAGLELLSLDTEPFALIRSLVGNDRSPAVIVDIGSVVTNLSVVVNGIPILSRSLDVGGLTVTKAIAKSLNVSLSKAEQLKYDVGLTPGQGGEGGVFKTIEQAMMPIVDELRYSDFYKNQEQKSIEKIILTGGSSQLLNLPEYLSGLMGVRVFLGNPWARVIYPEELKPVLDEVGPRFAVAIGLAMRDIE